MKSEPFRVGQRVKVSGGYDMDPTWLKGGHSYSGTLVAIEGDWAAVELDNELVLDAEEAWQDFGAGSASVLGRLASARGRWLAVGHGWEGQLWEEPVERLHVGLCSDLPNLIDVPKGGGIGAWVESHATMHHLRS